MACFVPCLAIAALLFVAVADAQTFRGAIQGTVLDSSGASVAGAQVTVTNTDTNLSREVKAGDGGDYLFGELPLGTYKVSAAKAGFKTAVVDGIKVATATIQRADLTLSPGEAKELVEVREAAALVDTIGDTQGGTLDSRQLADLPTNGRDFDKAILLVPGASADPAGITDSPGSFGTFSMNGNRGRSNNYLLDGTDMNDGYRNDPAINQAGVFGTPATLLPLDALAEIPVISGADAQFGRNAGAIVNIVTKSGTNELHGSAFEDFRNSAMDARNFFNTAGTPQNPFHNNSFGASMGGPIVKDRTFFFVAYEGEREDGGISSLGHVPTQADIATALASQTVAEAGGESPVIKNLLARNPWPSPNIAPDSNGNNLLATTLFTNRIDSVIGKIDQHFGKGDVLTGRYYFGNSDQSFPFAIVGGGVLPGFNTVTPTRVQLASASFTHIISPRLLVEVRSGYNRFAETFFPEDKSFDPRSIGLNTNQSASDTGLPEILVGGYATLGANTSVPRGRIDTNWQDFVNASYNTGRSNWKWGYEFRRTFVNGFFDNGYRGKLQFADLPSFLAGIPDSVHAAQGDSHRGTFQNNHGMYLQNSFRLAKHFMLDAGVRWDYYGVIGEEQGRLSIFDPTVPGGAKQVSTLYPKDYKNFAPRVGLAWDVFGTGKTVVRTGWGLFYDAFSQDFFVGQLPWNTFNPGPAYNGTGASPILFSGTAAITVTGGPCTGSAIKVPGTALCAPPVFSNFGASDVFTVAQNLRTPYVQNYNFNLQQELAPGLALQVGYVGSAGRKLFRYRDLNQSVGGGALPYPDFVYVNQLETSAVSNYNGLQTILKIETHGLTSSVNYTWSHSLDNASDGTDFVPNATQPDNSFNVGNEWANSNFDVRQRLAWNFLYELPSSSTHKKLLAGWAINGVVAIQTGEPVNLNYLFEGDFNGSDEYFGRPDLVGNPFAGRHFPNTFLDASAFAVPCTWDPVAGACVAGTQHFGNLGRNAFTGPSLKNFDFSLSKTTGIGERIKMQTRVDFFNLFNHPNFTNPMMPAFSLDFLQGSQPNAQGRGTGSIPITATADVGTGYPYLGGGGPRNIQLALKFSF
jgi:hypothetical protein